jgi:hypothetical protein
LTFWTSNTGFGAAKGAIAGFSMRIDGIVDDKTNFLLLFHRRLEFWNTAIVRGFFQITTGAGESVSPGNSVLNANNKGMVKQAILDFLSVL